MLKDEVMKVMNELFSKNNLDIKLNSLVIFRPVIHEPPFENMEVLNNADRLLSCNPVCTVFEMTVNGRRIEYESKYSNDDGSFSLTSYRPRFCEYFSGEDPKEVIEKMEQSTKFVLLIILSVFRILCLGTHEKSD